MPRALNLLALALAALSIPATSWSQIEIQIPARKDNTLYQNNAGAFSNGIGHFLFVGLNNHSEVRRALIAFDMTGKIPPGAKILSARLTLNLSKTISGPQTVTVHRVLADWGEGASDAGGEEGGGADARPGDATWIHTFFNTPQWRTAGGDFSPTASATLVTNALGFYTWESTPALVADVQAWLDAPENNFGWLLLSNESVKGSTKRFDSQQNPVTGNRPVLHVVYTAASRVAESALSFPQEYQLEQNYPNPFSPSTSISFQAPRDSGDEMALRIYDLNGRLVRQLVNGKLARGKHEVVWNGKNDFGERVANGVYIYRLETQGFSATRKLMLLE